MADIIQQHVDEALNALGGGDPLVMVYYWGALMSGANGSQQRTLSQLSFICQQCDNVVLYHFANHPSDPWTKQQEADFAARFPGIRLVSDIETLPIKILNKLKKLLVLCFPSLARQVYRLGAPSQAPNYRRLRAEHPEILYVVNYVDSLAQINGIAAERTIVETHDLRYFRRAKSSDGSLVSMKSLFALRYEISALSAAKSVITISPNETYFYRNMMPNAEIHYIPEYPTADAIELQNMESFDFDLLFAASGNAINVEGFCGLFADMGEKLRGFRIALCGLICGRPEIRTLAEQYPNITLLHFLSAEELQRTYARSKACLSPTHGTGLNIKLVEALRHGKPVFGSEASTGALTPGFQSCVFPLDAEAMTEFLSDAVRLREASSAAVDYYTRFSQRGDLEELAASLRGRSPVLKAVRS
ncbi:glycosyltransferase [Mangrovicoccus sp. HB161399]|uniref:glycosyltransferase n=1 Tax=Mangrovicoccus sp. HB161399 TaxID=2720392 RepID=UPI001552B21A|nr:glycosyltransferase [Mangrovicoccus sp. HB161399]